MNAACGADGPVRGLRLASWSALIFALWAIQHPYPGIYHDAQLYTLQALARVLPSELDGDVFLRFGSQDSFTFFSPLYAAAIRIMGAGPAAALLTACFHLAFAWALVLLAKRALPPRLVWLGVGLVCVIPFTYGARKVFFLMEDFVTPRLLAEALVIAGFAAAFDRRYLLALLAALLAALMHPIVAATGVAVALFLDVLSRRQRTTMLVASTACLLALFGVLAARGAPLRFDETWWPLVHGGVPYLFPLEWRATDWARALVVATLLFSGTRLPEGPARSLSRAALLALPIGIALSILGGDLLRLVLVTQLQPWRVTWLAGAIALLLSPFILCKLWHGGILQRCAATAIVAAFLLADERLALPVAAAAAALLLLAERIRHEPPSLRMVLFGMFGLLALALIINLNSATLVTRARFDQRAVPDWLIVIRNVSGTGVPAALVLIGASWVLARLRPAGMAAFAAGCVTLAAIFGAAVWSQWSHSPYTRETHAAFAPWRALLPARAEVLWFEHPLSAWALLDRPSFASNPQTAAVVFSREAGLLLHDRLTALQPFLERTENVAWRAPVPEEEQREPRLETACGTAGVRFVVSREPLDAAPIATASASLPEKLRDWKLYACNESPRTGSGS